MQAKMKSCIRGPQNRIPFVRMFKQPKKWD